MASAVARVDDSISHGGKITGHASKTVVEGKLVARVGDAVMCNQHGLQQIISGSPKFIVEGKAVARIGSAVSCGATVTTGAVKTNCE